MALPNLLIDPSNTRQWEERFRRRIAKSFATTRRAVLLGGLSALVLATVPFSSLNIVQTEDSLLFDFGGRRYRFALNGFGRRARVVLSRDGAAWRIDVADARVPGLSQGLAFSLHIGWRPTGWTVNGRENAAGSGERPVSLADWLAGLDDLPLAEGFVPSDTEWRLQPDRRRVRLSLRSSGALTLQAKKPIGMTVGDLSLAAGSLSWSHPEAGETAWHVALNHAAVSEGRLAPLRVDASVALDVELAGGGAGTLVLPPDRRQAAMLLWEGGASIRLRADPQDARFDLAADRARAAIRIARGRPTLRLWALSDGLLGKGRIGVAGFDFTNLPDGAPLRLEARAGRAEAFGFDLALHRMQVGVAGADLADWDFPLTPVSLRIGNPRERLFLADAILADDPELPQVPAEESQSTGHIALAHGTADFVVDVSASLLTLFRARDLFEARFGFARLRLVGERDNPAGARLTSYGSADNPPLLIVHFGPQHIEEQVYANKPANPGDGVEEIAEARASAPSRIAFRLDEFGISLPLTVEAFTKWNGLALNVSGRAFAQDSTVFDQLDYVGIGKGIGRRRAMELIRRSVELDRDMDTARPDSRRHIKTAIELRNGLIVSPPTEGTLVEAVETSEEEARLRGSQLWSARVLSGPGTGTGKRPKEAVVPQGKGTEPDRSAVPQAQGTRNLRVVWVRRIDLGFLHRLDTPINEDVPYWLPDPDPEDKATLPKFKRAVRMSYMRQLMTMTSVPALMAKRRLKALRADNGAPATDAELAAFLAWDPKTPPPAGLVMITFIDDPTGQVVAPPEGYIYPRSLLLAGGLKPEDVGIAVATTLGPSQLILTPWGANFRSRSTFEPYANVPTADRVAGADWGPSLNLELFHQESQLGEDIFVAVSGKGFLMPLGHRAFFLEITKREIRANAAHKEDAKEIDPTAYLIRRAHIAVSNPEKTFPALGQPFGGRAGPALQRIILRTVQSPEIINPAEATNDEDKKKAGRPAEFLNDAKLVFWPRQNPDDPANPSGSDILWDVGIDDESHSHGVPLLFVSNAVAQDTSDMARLVAYYRDTAPAIARTTVSGGQVHGYAPADDIEKTAFATSAIELSVSGRAQGAVRSSVGDPGVPVPDARRGASGQAENFAITAIMEGADQPGFFPTIRRSKVRVQSIDRLMRRQHGAVDVAWNRLWVEHGFAPQLNPSELFLDVLSRIAMDFSADGSTSGGFAKPNMEVVHLSRLKGPIGGMRERANAVRARAMELEIAAWRTSEAAVVDVETENATGVARTALRSGADDGGGSAAERGTFDPGEFLGASKFLGLLDMQKVLKATGMAEGAPKVTQETAYDAETGNGDNVFKRLEEELKRVAEAIGGAIAAFETSLLAAFSGLAGADGKVDIDDLYPKLGETLRQLSLALKNAQAEVAKEKGKLDKLPSADPKTAKEYARAGDRIGKVAAGLVKAVKTVKAEAEAIANDPVPQVVDKAIDDVQDAWNSLRRVLKTEAGAKVDAAVKQLFGDLLFEQLIAALPYASLIDQAQKEKQEQAAQFVAAMLGYLRRSELEIRAEIARRVNEGLEAIPGQPNATEDQINAYVDDVLVGDREAFAKRFQTDVQRYLEEQFNGHAALLRQSVESLLAREFGAPLSRVFDAVLRLHKLIVEEAEDQRDDIVDELVDLLRLVSESVLQCDALRQTSAAFQGLEDICETAISLLAGLDIQGKMLRLFGYFEMAETRILDLRQQLLDLKVPARPPELGVARGKAVAALNLVLRELADGRFLAETVAKDVQRRVDAVEPACLSLRELEPIGQLFRLQAQAIRGIQDVAAAMDGIIVEIDGAAANPAVAPLVQAEADAGRSQDLAALKKAVEDACGALKGGMKEVVGLGSGVDFGSVGAFAESVKNKDPAVLKTYGASLESSVGRIAAAAGVIAGRIDDIQTPKEAVAVLRDVAGFAAEQSETIASALAKSTAYGEDLLKEVESWARSLLAQALTFAVPLWDEIALPTLRKVNLALSDGKGTAGLGYFVKQELRQELIKTAQKVEAESNALKDIRDALAKDVVNFDTIRGPLHDLTRKEAELSNAVTLMRRLAESLLSGRFSDILSLDRLRDDLERAVLGLLPVKIGVVFPWATKIGDFPPGKPIFSIISPEMSDSKGGKMLENPRYWSVKDGKGGEESVREVFYPDATGKSISQAQFLARRGDFVLDAGASQHLLTGENDYWADAWLHPFSIKVLPGFDIVTLRFRAASFSAGKGKSGHLSAIPEDFELGKLVQFIAELTKYLSGGGEQGPYYDIRLLPPEIEVGVRYDLPTIYLGPVIFSQVSINVFAILPLANGEMTFHATLGRRSRPFLVSVPPYGGGGYLGLTATDRIRAFEFLMEYGAVVPLDLALIKGHGQVTAGIYIAKTVNGLTVFSGFLRAIGEGSIAIFGISVHIELSLTHVNGTMIGSVFVSFTFSVSIVDFTFSFTIERRIAGSGGAERFFAAYRTSALNAETDPYVRVHSPPRMTRWSEYDAGYPSGLVMPRRAARKSEEFGP